MIYSSLGLYRQRETLKHFLQFQKQIEGNVFLWGKKHPKCEHWIRNKLGKTIIYLEDGFLRSLGLGVQGYPPFAMVVDDMGIYYDTSRPSR